MITLSPRLVEKISSVAGLEVECLRKEAFPVLNAPRKRFVRVLSLLKNRQDLGFLVLSDIIVVDRSPCSKLLEVNYIVTSLQLKARLCVRVTVEDAEPLESISSLYKSAKWFEEEASRLFNITFLETPTVSPTTSLHDRPYLQS